VVRRVRLYPDPVLLERCAPAGPADAERLVADLVDTMRALPRCVGLAAPQIGEPFRVAVVDCAGHLATSAQNGLLRLVNPAIVEEAGSEVGREGCQSIPQYLVDVRRSRRIVVRSDRAPAVAWCAGFEARAVQHELDHLDGVLILDRAAGARAIHRRPGGGAD
jgi:peptide deformylase